MSLRCPFDVHSMYVRSTCVVRTELRTYYVRSQKIRADMLTPHVCTCVLRTDHVNYVRTTCVGSGGHVQVRRTSQCTCVVSAQYVRSTCGTHVLRTYYAVIHGDSRQKLEICPTLPKISTNRNLGGVSAQFACFTVELP